MTKIDVNQLEKLRKSFALLSQAIDFPDADTQKLTGEAQVYFPDSPEKIELISILQSFATTDLQDLKEDYTRLFELNRRLTLYTTYYKFEDSRERGTVLSKLKMLYEMFGVSLDMAEMTDYLPTMLEFLSLGQWSDGPVIDARIEDLQLLFSVLEDGTYELLRQGQEFANEPYLKLITVIRQTLKTCIQAD